MTTSDATTNPAAARVQKLERPLASPGACILCGKSEHPQGFADPRLDFEFYGTFYLCGDCVGDFATLFGWINPEQAVMLARRCDTLEKELEVHREALLHLESSFEELTNYRMLRNVISDTDVSDSVGESDSATAEETDEASSGNVIGFPTPTDSPESDSGELIEQQGSDDVPSTTGDESPAIPILEL